MGIRRAYISVINDLATDQRVDRVAKLLAEQGIQAVCLGRKLRNSPALNRKPFTYRRYRMLFTGGPLFYACFNLRLLVTLLFVRKPALLISNDLDTLPANFMAGRIRRIPLIYDSHELFTQVPELIHRRGVRNVWKWMESLLLPRLSHAVTVSYSIATIYRRLYGTRFRVVRNVPERIPNTSAAVHGKDGRTIIYQGALNVGRGLELMIDAISFLPAVRFVVVGTGDMEGELKKRVMEKGLGEQIEFKGRMMPEELVPLTSSADLGISLEEDLGLSYRYSLPNKLFDYIQGRVPVLCSALPEMSRVVDTYGIGISTRERDPEKLAGLIHYMLEERASGTWREALDRAAGELCWENESAIYLELLKECGVLKGQS